MKNIFKIAFRNLKRYKRRTLLTSSLIIFGVVLVIVFSGISSSFKQMMIGTITDSMLGHVQIHKKGYVSSIDNLPLHLNLKGKQIDQLKGLLDSHENVEAYTFRIKLGAMLSNYKETTNIRLTAVYPEMENKTSPALVDRIIESSNSAAEFVAEGELIIPENLAKGLSLKPGDDIVLVANNKDGSVNGIALKISGIMQGLTGPSGRDGYIHIEDAKSLLRIDGNEISEIAIRLKKSENLNKEKTILLNELNQFTNKNDKPVYELHTWAQLSPFSTIVTVVDLLIVTVKIVLVAIVLISILNVMMMSVYERISEIGTISAIGTLPSRILSLFLAEGFLLGLLSTAVGNVIGVLALYLINMSNFHFSFGRMQNILLQTTIAPAELVTVSFIVIAITLISSFQPALKASKMQPVDALRHV
ncbi:MAG: ABC transporter permease [Calditrichaeota bacterium]|nr:MAG: ABC transporter permease [Calditrichota bacterium]